MTHWYAEPGTLAAGDESGEADDAAVARVVRAFSARFGHEPDGVWAAPGRANLIGEHVDYHAGLCLPFALDRRTLAAVSLRQDDALHVVSAQAPDGAGPWCGRLAEVGPGRPAGWAGYVAGVPWALSRATGRALPGAEIALVSDVPVGAGLSSSAAVECAVALGYDGLTGGGLADDDAGRARLAAVCVTAENTVAGAPTGGMDQAAALRSRGGHALLLDCADGTARHVPLDLAAHGLAILVIDTRARHALVDGGYAARRAEGERGARLLGVRSLRDVAPGDLGAALEALGADPVAARRVRHVVTEIERVRAATRCLDAGDPAAVGPLLDASHASLRRDLEVSCPELDVACDAARGAGALGARMTGGGFGGSAVALLHEGSVTEVADAVDDAFAARGWTPPWFLRVSPSPGGGRLR